MKKKITLTIDDDVYDSLGELPRKVSISEVLSWVLRALVEDVKVDGMTDNEFIEYMDSDPRGLAVRQYLREKIGPIINAADSKAKAVKKAAKRKEEK